MSITYIDGVARGRANREERVRFLVDSGATYSLLPSQVWQSIGLEPRREQTFTLADGATIQRRISTCYLMLPQGQDYSPVILGEPGDEAEVAIEVAAALAAQAYRIGRQFGITTCTSDLASGGGSGQLELVLDLLARVDFDPSAPHLAPPIDAMGCVLVSLSGARRGSYGAYIDPASVSVGPPHAHAGVTEADRRAG